MKNLKTALIILFAVIIVILIIFLVKNLNNNNKTLQNDKISFTIWYKGEKI